MQGDWRPIGAWEYEITEKYTGNLRSLEATVIFLGNSTCLKAIEYMGELGEKAHRPRDNTYPGSLEKSVRRHDELSHDISLH